MNVGHSPHLGISQGYMMLEVKGTRVALDKALPLDTQYT